MKTRFTSSALNDLESIRDWIAAENPIAAANTMARILQASATLELFPLAGRAGRVDGTREWVVPRLPWFFVYELVGDDYVDIIAVIHSSRQWPPEEG